MKYLIIIIAFAVLATGCGNNSEAEQKADLNKQKTPPPALATVEKGGVSSVLKLPARLAAYQEVSLSLIHI